MLHKLALRLFPALFAVALVAACVPEGGVSNAQSNNSGGGGAGAQGGGGSGPDESLPASCPTAGAQVGACLLGVSQPWSNAGFVSGTVTSLDSTVPDCTNSSDFRITEDAVSIPGVGGPNTVAFTAQMDGIGPYQLALELPGFSANMVAPGTPIELRIGVVDQEWGGPTIELELRSQGALLAYIGADLSTLLEVTKTGNDLCYAKDGWQCGFGGRDMLVGYGGQQALVSHGASAVLGDLLITNDHMQHIYDLDGTCDYAQWIQETWLVGAAPAPQP